MALITACSRTGLEFTLDPGDEGDGPGGATTTGGASGVTAPTADASPTPLPDAATEPEPSPAPTLVPTSTPPGDPPRCTPSPERCNGEDDDCDGAVDEELPAIPCPTGGEQYCVAGRYSACPRRCEACVPGSERVCFNSFCTYWAVETCAADGRSFGRCKETAVPAECEGVASRHQNSPELEQCCLDNGYCCRDDHDLDGDGVRREMLGQCDEVACAP